MYFSSINFVVQYKKNNALLDLKKKNELKFNKSLKISILQVLTILFLGFHLKKLDVHTLNYFLKKLDTSLPRAKHWLNTNILKVLHFFLVTRFFKFKKIIKYCQR